MWQAPAAIPQAVLSSVVQMSAVVERDLGRDGDGAGPGLDCFLIVSSTVLDANVKGHACGNFYFSL
jgi:hypothetical protein